MKGPMVKSNGCFNIEQNSDSDEGCRLPDTMTSIHDTTNGGFVNDFNGYTPEAGIVKEIENVPNDIPPQEFFDKYVAKRKPVVIKGILLDSEWKCHNWTNKYLAEKAGNAPVIIEQRGEEKDSTFGLMAPKVPMSYGEFVENLMKGNDRLYMTTQDLERFEEDLDDLDMPKSVVAEPLKSLEGDYPIRPKILGNLIPYQLSLWQGMAKSGTSSGLHHDYHDNLYILLRGRKRFRLFAPSAAAHMRTAGKLAHIHSNGLIVYRNKPDDPTLVVRSDGVPFSFLARIKKDEAETDLAEAEERLEALIKKSDMPAEHKVAQRKVLEQRLEECEARMSQAMDDMLVFGCAGDIGSDISSDSENDDHLEPNPKRIKTVDLTTDALNVPEQCHHHHHASGDEASVSSENLLDQRQKMPDHFCDMSFPANCNDPAIIFKTYEHLKDVGYINCELSAGDMLYLPASWFHEVTSFTEKAESGKEPSALKCADDVGHLAFNYWMYPPDNDQFVQPYKDEFWTKRWEDIERGPPLPIHNIWSSDDEEDEGDHWEEEEEISEEN